MTKAQVARQPVPFIAGYYDASRPHGCGHWLMLHRVPIMGAAQVEYWRGFEMGLADTVPYKLEQE